MSERYEVLERIAEGGLGAVFRARDRQTGQEVALKRIRADKLGGCGATVDRLIREARQQRTVHHPNIVAVQDVEVDAEGGFIVMELVRGETLDARVQRGRLGAAEFDALVRQSLAGMAAAHASGIIHLDLKPENIMLQPTANEGFQVKILDFGLAQSVAEGPRPVPVPGDGLFGSVHYMAPEQFERLPLDTRTDIYALGCVFYHALTQKPPFPGDTSPQVIAAHRYHLLEPLASQRPDLPACTVQWVEWLLNRLPANRPASVNDALQVFLEKAAPHAQR